MCTNFCNGDGLLLHGFVNGHPVIFSHLGEEEGREKERESYPDDAFSTQRMLHTHLVKLIYTHHSTICQHHRPSLHYEVPLQ